MIPNLIVQLDVSTCVVPSISRRWTVSLSYALCEQEADSNYKVLNYKFNKTELHFFWVHFNLELGPEYIKIIFFIQTEGTIFFPQCISLLV